MKHIEQAYATNYDIVIIGGGLVGCSMAAALSHTKFKVLLLDAANGLHDAFKHRSMALSLASINFLTSLGVWQDLAGQSTPIDKVDISVRGKFGRHRIYAKEQGVVKLGAVLDMYSLEQAIYAAINAKVSILKGCSVHALSAIDNNKSNLQDNAQNDKYNWQLTFVNNQQGYSKEERTIKAKLILAADGINSMVAENLGIASKVTKDEKKAVFCNIVHEMSHNNTAYERFMQNGAIATLPFGKHKSTLVITVPKEQDLLALTDAEFEDYFYTNFGYKLGAIKELSVRKELPLSFNIKEQQTKHGVFLLGNAAHFIHPIAAQGLNLSLRDVAWLSKLLAEINDFSSAGLADLQVNYLRMRKLDQAQVINITSAIAKYMSGELPASIKATALLAIDFFGLNASIAKWGMGY